MRLIKLTEACAPPNSPVFPILLHILVACAPPNLRKHFSRKLTCWAWIRQSSQIPWTQPHRAQSSSFRTRDYTQTSLRDCHPFYKRWPEAWLAAVGEDAEYDKMQTHSRRVIHITPDKAAVICFSTLTKTACVD